jgi:O-antigen/teichoic acid export membrane protein
VVAAHFAASFVLLTVGGVFQARNEMAKYGAALFLDKATMAALLVLPLVTARAPLSLLAMYAVCSTGVAIWGLIVLRGTLWPPRWSRQAYRTLVAFSIPLIVSSWVGLLGTNWIDFVVIKWYRPLADVGLYALGVTLAGVVQQVAIVFSTLALPQLAVMIGNGEIDRVRTLVDRILPYWLLATSLLFSLVLLTADAIVPLVFGPAFEESARVLTLLMPAASALAIFSAFSPLLTARGATWVLTGIYLASGTVNVLFDIWLVPRYGIAGSALATIACYATSAAIVMQFARARLGAPVFRLAWLSLPVVLASVVLTVGRGPWAYAAAAASAAAAIAALMRAFRLFRGEDRIFFQSLRVVAPFVPGVPLAARRR